MKNGQIFNAAKWSSITEITAKLITPLTNMILARILAPEAFGVVATIVMITSFIDLFTDAGFQKYIIQRDFKNEVEKNKYANVAFITNFCMSIVIWIIIIFFSEEIAILVGNNGLGSVISVACVQLPLTALSSIQISLYRRSFNFKTLFQVRLVSILIPIVITVPIAYMGGNYWSIIIGNISMNITNVVLLTSKSNWKPSLFFDFNILKKMMSFSIWSMVESLSIWLTTWIDIFIIGTLLSEHLLGVYKTSTSMVNSLMSLVTASVIPVLFSALSRLNNNPDEFNKLYYNAQRLVSLIIFPLGVGIFLFRDLATSILLGSQWEQASDIIGIWALTTSIMIVFGNFCSEVYRAKGQPKLSFIAQLLHLIVLVPACMISVKFGFWTLVYTRSLIRFELIMVHFFFMKYYMGISIFQTIRNVFSVIVSTLLMWVIGTALIKIKSGYIWDCITILICITVYGLFLLLFPGNRKVIRDFYMRFSKKKLKMRKGLNV